MGGILDDIMFKAGIRQANHPIHTGRNRESRRPFRALRLSVTTMQHDYFSSSIFCEAVN